jgi:hypothetical protein
MSYVYQPRDRFYAAFDPERCAASVSYNNGWRSRQCTRKGTIEEDGHKWCGQHAPSREKARQDESDRKFRARIANSPAVRLGHEYMRRKALEQAIDDYLAGRIDTDALRQIRNAGTNL